jgi:hypothetical protein
MPEGGRPETRLGDRQRVDCLLMALTLGVVVAVIPLLPPCGFLEKTGVPCPFCGGRRALIAAGVGDWIESLRFNPTAVAWVTLAAILFVIWLAEAATGRPIGSRRAFRYPLYALAAITLAVWILRVTGLSFPMPES